MLRATAVPVAVIRRPSPFGVQAKPRARANPQPGGNEPPLPIAAGVADAFEHEARGVARAVPVKRVALLKPRSRRWRMSSRVGVR